MFLWEVIIIDFLIKFSSSIAMWIKKIYGSATMFAYYIHVLVLHRFLLPQRDRRDVLSAYICYDYLSSVFS